MPWNPGDAHKHTHKANTAKKQRQWAHVANSELESGKSEATAIKAANAVVGRSGHFHKGRGDSG